MNKQYLTAALLTVLVGVFAVQSYADHAQVTISLMPDTEVNCSYTDCVNPPSVALDPNGEAIWSNDGSVAISVSGGDSSSQFINSGTLQPGQTYSLTFPNSGTYTYSVGSYPWMTGTITVTGGHDHGDHDHGDTHMHDDLTSDSPIGIAIDISVDDEGGAIIHTILDGWTFSPETVNQENEAGVGHTHIYVDGVKVNRAYGPYHYIGDLEPGSHLVMVEINANDHSKVTVDGQDAEASAMIIIPDSHDHAHGAPDSVEGTASMSITAVAHTDAIAGYNLEITLSDFVLSGQNANGNHVAGEGYVELSIDGKHNTRIYESWFHMDALEPGTHTITLSLMSNDHAPYHLNGNPVETTITIQVPDA